MRHDLENIKNLFYPPEKEVSDPSFSLTGEVKYSVNSKMEASVTLTAGGRTVAEQATETELLEGGVRQGRRLARLLFYRSLRELTGREGSPWGILTGVRPTKVGHFFADRGFKPAEMETILVRYYGLREDKARLLVEVVERERELLPPERWRRGAAVYVSIPFCPSRCAYCSFPSFPYQKERVREYLQVLRREIEGAAELIARTGLEVYALYVGGGTPTVLAGEELADLLDMLTSFFAGEHLVEFTVEAGRPDTVGVEKLSLLRTRGVNRVSINPQSFHTATLAAIGRAHSPEEVEKAYFQAREAGFPIINMDLIIGLPGEKEAEVAATVAKVIELEPENVTLHSLALKKGSLLLGAGSPLPLPGDEEAARMMDLARESLRQAGYRPYYLYRQKRIAGLGENVGLARPGTECLYNMAVIEEKGVIFGLGAGATSKVGREEGTVVNIFHTRDPAAYVRNWEEKAARREEAVINCLRAGAEG